MLLLPTTLTVSEARATQRLLAQALKCEPDGSVTVDASHLKQFDSAALAVLLDCRRLASVLGRPLVVRGMPPKLLALATLYGVAALLADTAVGP